MTQLPKVTATFHPQAWVGDYAMPVDPAGETVFDITEDLDELSLQEIEQLPDDSYETDALRESESVPLWIREWTGPFWVEVDRDELAAYVAFRERFNLHRAQLSPHAVLEELVDTIEVTGGIMDRGGEDAGIWVPCGDPSWSDLAHDYIQACWTLGRTPVIEWNEAEDAGEEPSLETGGGD